MSVIERGSFDLTQLLRKIDEYHIEGKLSDDDKTELYVEARKAAKPLMNYSDEISIIVSRLNALESKVQELEQELGNEPLTPAEEYPEWVRPTGAHDAYFEDDLITFEGQHYRCLMDFVVWSPLEYPDGWESLK